MISRRLVKIFIKGFQLMTFSLLLFQFNIATEFSNILKGTITNSMDKPMPNVKIEVESIKTQRVKRVVYSRENGTWTLPFLPNGYWKITAFSKEYMSHPLYIHLVENRLHRFDKINRETINNLRDFNEPDFDLVSPGVMNTSIKLVLDLSSTKLLIYIKKEFYQKK